LGAYVQKGILPEDPFISLDRNGVGRLVELGVTEEELLDLI